MNILNYCWVSLCIIFVETILESEKVTEIENVKKIVMNQIKNQVFFQDYYLFH